MEGALAAADSATANGSEAFREDVMAMDDTKENPQRIHVKRAFGYSRLGPELMAAAYERLVPIQRMSVPHEQQGRPYSLVEKRLCAV
jgi:hypothetical protein